MEIDDVIKGMAMVIVDQDNAHTCDPIFFVQRHRRTYGFDPSFSDDHVVYMCDGEPMDPEELKREYDEAMAEEEEQPEIESYDEWQEKFYKRHRSEQVRSGHTEDDRKKLYAEFVERQKDQLFRDWCDENDSYTKTGYQDTWENVQPFFTRAGAERYLRINGHNLRGHEPPRIFVDSAFRNAEWQAIRAMLLKMASDAKSAKESDAKRDERYRRTELYDADPSCEHETYLPPGGGVKCRKCPGWFCY